MQGDTLQNVAHQLDKILETGYYSFTLSIDGEAQIGLVYTPSANQTTSMEESTEDGPPTGGRTFVSQSSRVEQKPGDLEGGKGPKQEQWNSEQIGDFVRKLGFMDTEKEGGEKIKHFRHISAVSTIIVYVWCIRIFFSQSPKLEYLHTA